MTTIDTPREAHLPAMRRLWQEAFGDTDGFLDDFFGTAYAPDRARILCEEGEVVAMLYWLDVTADGRRWAYLYAIATAVSHRGRGLCRRLLDDTHAHLARLGYAGTLLVPSERSLFDFYARAGYVPCAPMRLWECEAAREPIALTRVRAEEYAARRRSLLPRGGVRQEGESLRLLETQNELYAADRLLVAVRKGRRDGALFADELLGDASLAPHVLRALGAPRGRFRVAGGDQPFAMARPFADDRPPTYFAFAFD